MAGVSHPGVDDFELSKVGEVSVVGLKTYNADFLDSIWQELAPSRHVVGPTFALEVRSCEGLIQITRRSAQVLREASKGCTPTLRQRARRSPCHSLPIRR